MGGLGTVGLCPNVMGTSGLGTDWARTRHEHGTRHGHRQTGHRHRQTGHRRRQTGHGRAEHGRIVSERHEYPLVGIILVYRDNTCLYCPCKFRVTFSKGFLEIS
jgi:hypothetical protein